MPEPEGRILVPFCIESSLSEVCRTITPDQVLWYGTTVSPIKKWKGSKVLLHFDAVDWSAEVFANGKKIGEHTGGYTSFCLDITEYLDKKVALTVKVWDPSDGKAYNIPHGKQVASPRGVWYTSVSGIWQSVWMEAVSPLAHIADYNVENDINGTIKVKADVEGAQSGDKIRVDVLRPVMGYNPEHPDSKPLKGASAMVCAGQTASITVAEPELWTPETPYLYGMTISLVRNGRVIDRVDGYTAIRSIGRQQDDNGVWRMALNGQILFQMGPLDQGWWPDGLYTAPTAEAMLYDIKVAKNLGFNMIRKHIKVEPSRWYYDCDREGILVWQDMPSTMFYPERNYWGQGEDRFGAGRDCPLTGQQKANFQKEWAEIIAQLRKFQCIVSWIPFNECWGQFDTGVVAEFTRSLDSTRLINAASGGNWHKGVGDIVDSHRYPAPAMRIIDPENINVLGEYGGIARQIEGHVWKTDRKWGYVSYDSAEKVSEKYVEYAGQLRKLKENEACAAAVYTQITDVEGEINGLLTYDRAVLKVVPEKIWKANRGLISAARDTTVVPVRYGNYERYLWITFDRGAQSGRYSYGSLYFFIADKMLRVENK